MSKKNFFGSPPSSPVARLLRLHPQSQHPIAHPEEGTFASEEGFKALSEENYYFMILSRSPAERQESRSDLMNAAIAIETGLRYNQDLKYNRIKFLWV
jgi:hypothetical protein